MGTFVALAYAWGGHDPDDVIEVDQGIADVLWRDGKARIPTPADLDRSVASDKTTVPALRAYAEEHNIDLAGATRKGEIQARITEAMSVPSVPEPESPATGADTEES